jgi:pimeloyl-ACP methyl ester carboxylesterase
MHDLFCDNDGVGIHAIVTRGSGDIPPLVVVPGMIGTAEEYAAIMAPMLTRPAVFISIRGRGASDSPERGYSFADQVSDVAAVVEQLELRRFHLFGHSIGGALALGYAIEQPEWIVSLAISDYGPRYPTYGDAWVEGVLAAQDPRITEHAVRQLAEESEKLDMSGDLERMKCPVLITRGSERGSLLDDEAASLYTRNLRNPRIEVLAGAAHSPFNPTPEPFMSLLDEFCSTSEAPHEQ